jgi:hypothetical protein
MKNLISALKKEGFTKAQKIKVKAYIRRRKGATGKR